MTARSRFRRGGDVRVLIHHGEVRTLPAWAARVGIDAGTVWARIFRRGWMVADALTVPVGHPRRVFVPPLQLHKGTGQAYVRFLRDGRRVYRYFGVWGTEKAAEGYRRFVADWCDRQGSSVDGSGLDTDGGQTA